MNREIFSESTQNNKYFVLSGISFRIMLAWVVSPYHKRNYEKARS